MIINQIIIFYFHGLENTHKRIHIFTLNLESEKGGLREFMLTELGWEWVKGARISLEHNDRKIMINGTNPDFKAYIFVDTEKKKAYLRYGKVKYDFIMEEERTGEFYCQYKNKKNI